MTPGQARADLRRLDDDLDAALVLLGERPQLVKLVMVGPDDDRGLVDPRRREHLLRPHQGLALEVMLHPTRLMMDMDFSEAA